MIKENISKLIEIAKENPTLEVIAMVNSEVVGSDDYSSWLGKIGEVEIDESWSKDERIYFKSIDDEELIDDTLEKMACKEQFKELSDEELLKIAEEEVNNLEWTKVIVVKIDTP